MGDRLIPTLSTGLCGPLSWRLAIAICLPLCHNLGLPAARLKGCRGGGEMLKQHAHEEQPLRRAISDPGRDVMSRSE
jgi:hypothetical protein